MAWRKKSWILWAKSGESSSLIAVISTPKELQQSAAIPLISGVEWFPLQLRPMCSRHQKGFEESCSPDQYAIRCCIRFSRICSQEFVVGFFQWWVLRVFQQHAKHFLFLSKRGFSNGTLLGTTQKVQWVGGTAGLKKNRSQLSHFILPVCGKRNCNFATVTEKLKRSTTTTQKAKETVSEAKVGANLAEVRSNELLSGILKPVNSAMQTVMGLRQALGLHLEAFWKRNYLVVVGAVAVLSCLLLWRIMFGIASLFVSLSEGMAKFGFLALAAGMVAIGVSFRKCHFLLFFLP